MTEISIGIPAYNEQANIKSLLVSLLAQKENGFKIKEIVITSDQSSDNTVKEIKSIDDNRISVIENQTRLGQALSQNVLVENTSSDILILLNADIIIKDFEFISKLIAPFSEQQNVGMVSSQVLPLEGKNYFEKVINYSVAYKKSLFYSWKGGNNLFLCMGAARAFSREFLKTFKWQPIISEDAYSYLSCINNGYKFIYTPKTSVYIKSPNNFQDHMKQSARFLNSTNILRKFFKDEVIDSEYSIPLYNQIVTAIKYFFMNPLYFISFVAIYISIKFHPQRKTFVNYKWEPSQSSK